MGKNSGCFVVGEARLELLTLQARATCEMSVYKYQPGLGVLVGDHTDQGLGLQWTGVHLSLVGKQ